MHEYLHLLFSHSSLCHFTYLQLPQYTEKESEGGLWYNRKLHANLEVMGPNCENNRSACRDKVVYIYPPRPRNDESLVHWVSLLYLQGICFFYKGHQLTSFRYPIICNFKVNKYQNVDLLIYLHQSSKYGFNG